MDGSLTLYDGIRILYRHTRHRGLGSPPIAVGIDVGIDVGWHRGPGSPPIAVGIDVGIALE